ncbi:hypothetical protein LEP1GSC067_2533 [Leptospira interrogans serovar Lora str. TE 1992]|uniref:Uncharacterized protein n=1 Tax=Leptospira interrogans serovar Lora str. TE 1992 TaxID=1193028 RepID=M3CN22_LEPIR|nr:hypothetical protein LEP1GSC067_2533 [Leptospira interrogans serovar Lora str. TE 1992]EMN08358.1 hypothetical protein LEP1GSC053_2791 [Leptospira interrogans serovar Muenchen str. Brem 129]
MKNSFAFKSEFVLKINVGTNTKSGFAIKLSKIQSFTS